MGIIVRVVREPSYLHIVHSCTQNERKHKQTLFKTIHILSTFQNVVF